MDFGRKSFPIDKLPMAEFKIGSQEGLFSGQGAVASLGGGLALLLEEAPQSVTSREPRSCTLVHIQPL